MAPQYELYRAMAVLGFTPEQVDRMEPWQVLAILGWRGGN